MPLETTLRELRGGTRLDRFVSLSVLAVATAAGQTYHHPPFDAIYDRPTPPPTD